MTGTMPLAACILWFGGFGVLLAQPSRVHAQAEMRDADPRRGSPDAERQHVTEVYLIGALGALHDREEAFDFPALDGVIRTVDPDVMLLEVTPEELAGRLDTRGRPEYPRVVWPLLEEAGAPTAYAMEAGEPEYSELTDEAIEAWGAFAADHPSADRALATWEDATTQALLAYWESSADTQDAVTDTLARARHRLRGALFPAGEALQERWDQAMVDALRAVIIENPGARVLVIGSFRNRFMFADALEDLPGVALIDMGRWLEENRLDD